MRTVLVPTFDEFNHYKFKKYVRVRIKNKPDLDDVHAITRYLPGICQGAVGPSPLKELLAGGKKDVRSFYDGRQNTKMLRGFFVILIPQRSK